ncbi:MAG: ribose-phosphate diphosphokinase [Bacillota bacterium]
MRLYACPGNEPFSDLLARELGAAQGRVSWHRFPDRETLVRIETPPQGEGVALVCALADPDPKLLPLLFAAEALREQGARQVGLVAPYLAYMRQDTRFHPGETVSARHFGSLLARHFDWLVTVDPHLHRLASLSQVFPKPNRAAQAAPALAEWIRAEARDPLLIGPDAESAQWVSAVAQHCGAPWTHLTKERLGDREVRVSLPDADRWRGRQAVLVDDIVSTGETMVAAARRLKELGFAAPLCVAVHGLFAEGARQALLQAGVARIAVTNSVPQPDSLIDVAPPVAAALRTLLAAARSA